MKKGYLYETPIDVFTNDTKRLLCYKGIYLEVVRDCFDEEYLHEVINYNRPGLKEKSLKKGSIVEVLGYWSNFYGSYIKCNFNNESYDINPKNLSFRYDIQPKIKGK